jgi:hypothetical protein
MIAFPSQMAFSMSTFDVFSSQPLFMHLISLSSVGVITVSQTIQQSPLVINNFD